MALVKLLDSTSNPVLTATGDFIWVWDDQDIINDPVTETDDGGICDPSLYSE